MAAETSGNRGSASTKKATTKKSSTKQSSTKQSSAKKAPAKKSGSGSRSRSRSAGAPRAEAPRRMSGSDIAAAAVRHLGELVGKEVSGVRCLERTDDGWRVELDVLELRRVPNTTDVLGTYEVTVDMRGELEGYRRVQRYIRGTPGEDGS